MYRITLLLILLVSSALPALAESACETQFDSYAPEWVYRRADLRHKEVIWLKRDTAGKFLPSDDVAALTNPGAAIEISLYLTIREIPTSLKTGIMIFDAREPYKRGSGKEVISHSGFLVPNSDGRDWFQKIDKKNLIFFSVYLVDAKGCVVGEIEVGDMHTGAGYDTNRALLRPNIRNVDVSNIRVEISIRKCGSEYVALPDSLGLWDSDPLIEDRVTRDGRFIMSVSSALTRPIVMKGKEVSGFTVSYFPARTTPRITLEDRGFMLDLPKYMGKWQIPHHIAVQCEPSGNVTIRYVSGGEEKRFDNIPIE